MESVERDPQDLKDYANWFWTFVIEHNKEPSAFDAWSSMREAFLEALGPAFFTHPASFREHEAQQPMAQAVPRPDHPELDETHQSLQHDRQPPEAGCDLPCAEAAATASEQSSVPQGTGCSHVCERKGLRIGHRPWGNPVSVTVGECALDSLMPKPHWPPGYTGPLPDGAYSYDQMIQAIAGAAIIGTRHA